VNVYTYFCTLQDWARQQQETLWAEAEADAVASAAVQAAAGRSNSSSSSSGEHSLQQPWRSSSEQGYMTEASSVIGHSYGGMHSQVCLNVHTHRSNITSSSNSQHLQQYRHCW
jgi:hypothetical protein